MYKYSEKSAASAVKSILKNAEDNGRTKLSYTWINNNGLQCACDGLRAVRLNRIIPGLPEISNDLQSFDLQKVYDKVDLSQHEYLPVPSKDEIESLIADDKAHKTRSGYDDGDTRRGKYFFGQGLPVVNLWYLRDMLRIIPDARISYTPGHDALMLYFSGENGDGLLCPLRDFSDDHSRRAWAPREKDHKPAPVAFTLNQFAARYAAA